MRLLVTSLLIVLCGAQQAQAQDSRIYLNRCVEGCSVLPGVDDSRTNRSSIIAQASQIAPWRHGDAVWQELVACVTEVYAPYNVEVGDVDPGNTPHHEAIIAGQYTDIGHPVAVSGLAVASCQPGANLISYTFANGFIGDALEICQTVAQETAHSYGLEHVFNCADAMSNIGACSQKFYRDEESQCGSFSPLEECECGGTTQNSHRLLLDLLGESPTPLTGPLLEFITPLPGALVENAFEIVVEATHPRGIDAIEFVLNEVSYDDLEADPSGKGYRFSAPSDLSDGIIDIEVRAQTDLGSLSTTTRTVQKGLRCTSTSCAAGEQCSDGRCLPLKSDCGCMANGKSSLSTAMLMLMLFALFVAKGPLRRRFPVTLRS